MEYLGIWTKVNSIKPQYLSDFTKLRLSEDLDFFPVKKNIAQLRNRKGNS